MDWILGAVVGIFFLEQLVSVSLGSYPYRVGIPVGKVGISARDVASWSHWEMACTGLRTKTNERRRELYCRYRYPSGVGGPFVFVGQARASDPGIVVIRMGPSAAVLLAAITILSVQRVYFGEGLLGLINVLVVAGAAVFFYFSLARRIRECDLHAKESATLAKE
jgi:hypothetical protein